MQVWGAQQRVGAPSLVAVETMTDENRQASRGKQDARGVSQAAKREKMALISDHLALLGQEAADESRVRSTPSSAEGCRRVGNRCKPTFQHH
jgi:hypothetical protein